VGDGHSLRARTHGTIGALNLQCSAVKPDSLVFFKGRERPTKASCAATVATWRQNSANGREEIPRNSGVFATARAVAVAVAAPTVTVLV
jgi:hypothetical protein